MPLIGNTIGLLRYVDVPITAGTNPTVQFTTDRVLDLIGIDVLAPGATAAALKVNGATVGAGAIASFSGGKGNVWAADPAFGVPLYTGSQGATQANQTANGVGFYANWQSSGTVQSGITDRNGSVPNPGAQTPISAAIANGVVVEVDLTGTVVPVTTLPAADGNGFINLPTGNAQGTNVTLTSALTLTATTTLAVTAIPAALPVGTVVLVGQTDSFVLSAAASANATSLTVTSKTPTVAWPIGTNVLVGREVDAVDNIPFRVKASDTLLDTFAGIVRLVFQIAVSDPNASAKAAGTYPNNGVQKGSGGIY